MAVHGVTGREYRWASVTKPVTALACLVAAEEGTIDLDDAAGPPGSTFRHLLAHASGLPLEGASPIARPGERRIYSDHGFDVLGAALAEHAEMPFADYLREAVLEPLGLRARYDGRPGLGASRLARRPARARPRAARADARSRRRSPRRRRCSSPGWSACCPASAGRSRTTGASASSSATRKSPHWTGAGTPRARSATSAAAAPSSGSTRSAGVALGCLTDRDFGDWAVTAWPALSDAVLAELR